MAFGAGGSGPQQAGCARGCGLLPAELCLPPTPSGSFKDTLTHTRWQCPVVCCPISSNLLHNKVITQLWSFLRSSSESSSLNKCDSQNSIHVLSDMWNTSQHLGSQIWLKF